MTANLSVVRVLRAVVAAGAVAVGVSFGGAAAAASGTACSTGGVHPPNVGSGNNFLQGVAATSACNAWAVGYYHTGTKYLTLIEHWTGKAWKVQPSVNSGDDSRLMGVAATSTGNAWAVGGPLIEHWNGTAWTVQLNEKGDSLAGVAATSATNAWAVGSSSSAAVVEHWNGTTWKTQSSPCPKGAQECGLSGVAATSATNAWAVGHFTGSAGENRVLVEHWNGQAWKVQTSPNPTGANTAGLTGVAATSATNAWAVGSYFQQGAGALTVIEHWDGKTWTIEPSPNPGGGDGSELNGVAATSAKNVWAVGDIDFSNGAGKTLVEHWNGSTWSVQPSPNPGSKSNALDGVAASSATNVWAVGDYHNAITQPPARNLVLRFNGSSWDG